MAEKTTDSLPLVRVGERCPDGPHRHSSSLHQTECDLRREIKRDDKLAVPETTTSWRGVEQTAKREEWLGEIQEFLEARMADAPDETCRILASDMWHITAEFTDEDT
jgi:hypothetical protein